MEELRMAASDKIEKADDALKNLSDMLFVAADGYYSGHVEGGAEAAGVLYCIRENLAGVRAYLDEAIQAVQQIGRAKETA